MSETHRIPQQTLQRLQQLQQRQQDTIQTLMEVMDLDPRTHEVNLREGVIQPIQQPEQ